MMARRGAMDAWDPWLGGIAWPGKARQGMGNTTDTARACHAHAMPWLAWTWAWAAQQPNLAGPDDPAWRSRNTGDGQEGVSGERAGRARERNRQTERIAESAYTVGEHVVRWAKKTDVKRLGK